MDADAESPGGWIQWIKKQFLVARKDIREGRFQHSMAALAGCGAVISGFEAYSQHLRGAFSNRIMWTPIVLTPPMTAAVAGSFFSRRTAETVLPALSISWLGAGVIGSYFHIRGIRRMAGGFELGRYNLTMGPPMFAPLLLTSVGIMGLLAGFLRPEIPPRQEIQDEPGEKGNHERDESELSRLAPEISHGEFQKRMAAIAALFGALAGGEAYFGHLRSSFNKIAMWTPVLITPLVAGAGLGSIKAQRVARHVLPWVSGAAFADGLAGAVLHFQGLRRMPGGLSNLKFNFTMGPPLFAPLLLTMVGLLGLTASFLRRKGP